MLSFHQLPVWDYAHLSTSWVNRSWIRSFAIHHQLTEIIPSAMEGVSTVSNVQPPLRTPECLSDSLNYFLDRYFRTPEPTAESCCYCLGFSIACHVSTSRHVHSVDRVFHWAVLSSPAMPQPLSLGQVKMSAVAALSMLICCCNVHSYPGQIPRFCRWSCPIIGIDLKTTDQALHIAESQHWDNIDHLWPPTEPYDWVYQVILTIVVWLH